MCNNDCKCISDILKVISILQRNVEREEDNDDFCDRKTLGHSCCRKCNTRPIQLFTCGMNGDDPLIMPTTKGPITPATKFSSVFRVEKVDDCCCTCRVLVARPGATVDAVQNLDDCEEFTATNSFFTIDLKCVCIVRCLNDTFVDCL